MRFAVLLDAESERLHAPIFHLGELAAEAFHHRFEAVGQGLDLLGRDVLTRHVDVLVERHLVRAFLSSTVFRREAPRARGERPDDKPRRRGHGTPACCPVGRNACPAMPGRPFSPPAETEPVL